MYHRSVMGYISECFISDNVKQFKNNREGGVPNYYIDENDQLFLLSYHINPLNYIGAILDDNF
jgi:hypothetical protein